MSKNQYRPVLPQPFLVWRTLTAPNKKEQIWSKQQFLNFNDNDYTGLQQFKNKFLNNIEYNTEKDCRQVQLNNQIFEFSRKITQFKICLPAGTILTTFEI